MPGPVLTSWLQLLGRCHGGQETRNSKVDDRSKLQIITDPVARIVGQQDHAFFETRSTHFLSTR